MLLTDTAIATLPGILTIGERRAAKKAELSRARRRASQKRYYDKHREEILTRLKLWKYSKAEREDS